MRSISMAAQTTASGDDGGVIGDGIGGSGGGNGGSGGCHALHASKSMPLQAAATLTFECAMRAAGSANQPAARHERRAARVRQRSEKTFVSVSIIPFARASHIHALRHHVDVRMRDARSRICKSACSATREASGARATSKREDLRERLDHPVRPREPSTRAAAPPLMPDICNRGVCTGACSTPA